MPTLNNCQPRDPILTRREHQLNRSYRPRGTIFLGTDHFPCQGQTPKHSARHYPCNRASIYHGRSLVTTSVVRPCYVTVKQKENKNRESRPTAPPGHPQTANAARCAVIGIQLKRNDEIPAERTQMKKRKNTEYNLIWTSLLMCYRLGRTSIPPSQGKRSSFYKMYTISTHQSTCIFVLFLLCILCILFILFILSILFILFVLPILFILFLLYYLHYLYKSFYLYYLDN